VLVVSVWAGQYRGQLILNIACLFEGLAEVKREELILNFTLCVLRVWVGNMQRK